MKTSTTIRRILKVRDIPDSWGVELPDDPEAPVTVWISPADIRSERRLVDFIGSGKGVHKTRAAADRYIRRLRADWQN
jgi:hypothetical protein